MKAETYKNQIKDQISHLTLQGIFSYAVNLLESCIIGSLVYDKRATFAATFPFFNSLTLYQVRAAK
jgi:hypothetical protein